MYLEPPQDGSRQQSADPQDARGRVNRIIQSARIQGPKAWVNLLQNREVWNMAPEAAQDEVVAEERSF